MFKIYFDTNIYSNIRNNRIDVETKNNIDFLKDIFIIYFSSAHLYDYTKSSNLEEYLTILENYTKNNFIHFYEFDYKFSKSLVFENFTPIQTYEKIQVSEQYSKLLENHNDLFFQHKTVSEIRNLIQEYYNPDKYKYDINNPTDYKEKFNSVFGMTFIEYVELTSLKGNNAMETNYRIFMNYYVMLELLKITTEKAGGKTKKNSMESLRIDAQHAFYASFTDYFVTDDKGLKEKAEIIYEYFDVKTKVIITKELNLLMPQIRNNEISTYEEFTKDINIELKKISKLVMVNDNPKTDTAKLYFNYFNKFEVFINEEYLNYYFYSTNFKTTKVFKKEIQLIQEKLDFIFKPSMTKGVTLPNIGLDDKEDNKELNKWFIYPYEIRLWLIGQESNYLNLQFTHCNRKEI